MHASQDAIKKEKRKPTNLKKNLQITDKDVYLKHRNSLLQLNEI